MGKKNLIKKVTFRKEKDFRGIEGGGNDDIPKWIQENYTDEKFEFLIKNTGILKDEVKKRSLEYEEFPIIVEAIINPRAKAKSYRDSINEIFIDKDLSKIVALKGDNRLLYSIDAKNTDTISNRLAKSKNKETIVAAIDDIKTYKMEIDKNLMNIQKLKIKLVDFHDEKLNEREERLLFEKLENVHIKKIKYPNNEIIYEAINDQDIDFFSELEKMPFVESVEEMLTFDFGDDFKIDFFDVPSVPEIDPTKEYPLVGVFDSGVNQDVIKNWCKRQYSPYILDDINDNHGTQVSSLVCFGEQLNSLNLGVEGCQIISCVAMIEKITSEAEILINLENSLKKYSNKAQIWNLSLGSKTKISKDKFSSFAMNLDFLQKKYNVLFVKSSGNCTNHLNSSINCGAESLRALTVGSINHTTINTAVKNKVSSFSKVGPGPYNTVKPDLVYYGGSVCKKTKNAAGIVVIDTNGEEIQNAGTSFSTPQISAIAAHLAKKIKEPFSPMFIKGLLVHKSSYLEEMMEEEENIRFKYGHGVPPKIDEILHDADNEITMIFNGSIPKGESIGSLDIPFPEELIDELGELSGEIILTSIVDPILIKNQGLEYSQTDLKVAFGTYSEKRDRTLTNPRAKYAIGTKNPINLLLENNFSKRIVKSNTEEALRKNGKYSPLKKYSVNLSTLQNAKKNAVIKNKKWYLTLTPEYNNYIENITPKEDLFLDYCVFITIKSKNDELNLALTNELEIEEYNPVNLEINIENKIDVL